MVFTLKGDVLLKGNMWISVEDKLPEDGVDVLVFGILLHSESWRVNQGYYAGEWRSVQSMPSGRPRSFNKVTHWMPLPEEPSKD